MMVNFFNGIFTVSIKNQVCTMNFTNADFIAMKIKITSFSWLFHNLLIKVGFIVLARGNTGGFKCD